MIEQPALAPHGAPRASHAGYAAGARKRRTLFWTIVVAVLVSLGLWLLLGFGVAALVGALAG